MKNLLLVCKKFCHSDDLVCSKNCLKFVNDREDREKEREIFTINNY